MNNEIMQLCRLCLVKDQADIPIFTEQDDNRQIFKKITACLSIWVSKDDSLPKKICASCLEKLDSFYHFWNTTVDVEKQLLTWLEQASAKTEFKIKELHSIKLEELDPPEHLPQNIPENFVSCSTQSPMSFHFQGEFSESQIEFDSVKVEGFQSNDFENINKSCTPTEMQTHAVPKLAVNGEKAYIEEEFYKSPSATIVKREKDNQTINSEDIVKSPQISEIRDKQSEMQNIGPETKVPTFGKEAPSFFQVPSTGQCHICGKIFLRRGGLKQHMLVHTDERPVSCDICFKGFKDKFSMQDHRRYHSDETPFKCDTCDKTFKRKISLQVHEKRHIKDYKMMCEMCNRGFYTNVEYKLHMGSRHGQSSNICSICNKALYDKCSLNKHMQTHMEGYKDPKYKCDLCGKGFLQERYLKNHIDNQHSDGSRREYVCDLCGKKLCSGTSLRSHQLLHQGIKPNKCYTCGKAFTLRSALMDHLRIHTGEKPYKCEHCNKAFTQRNTYVIHVRSHTGERPYVCQLCNTGFISRTVLNLHHKSKHNLL